MVKISSLLILLIFNIYTCCFSQTSTLSQPLSNRLTENYLVLRNNGAYNRIRFFAGDKITFKRKGEEKRITAEISQVRKHSIVVWDTNVPLSEIDQITVLNKSRFGKVMRLTGGLARKSGGLFSVVGAGNYLLTSQKNEAVTTIRSGLPVFTFGHVLLIFKRRKYNITKKRPLQVLQRYVY